MHLKGSDCQVWFPIQERNKRGLEEDIAISRVEQVKQYN